MLLHRLMNLLVKLLNFCLLVFGYHPLREGQHPNSRDRRAWVHWSNENVHGKSGRWEDRKYGVPYHGRIWLHLPGNRCIQWTWNFWTHFCHAYVAFHPSGDNDVTFSLALPPVAFWFSLEGFAFRHRSRSYEWWKARYGYNSRKIGISVFDWAIWWDLWVDENGSSRLEGESWMKKTPRWRHSNWHFVDTLLGRWKYKNEVLSTHEVLIPMPEGGYPATVKLELATWKRPRWPFVRERRRAQVDIPIGIPHQGKGENSWDCGEDALFGFGSGECFTVPQAISQTVESVLNSRRKYDGDVMAKYPPVAERIAAYEAREARMVCLKCGGSKADHTISELAVGRVGHDGTGASVFEPCGEKWDHLKISPEGRADSMKRAAEVAAAGA